MSSNAIKKVLVAGLGSLEDKPEGKGCWTSDKIRASFQDQIDQAKQAGFDLQIYLVDTTVSHDITTKDLRAALQTEKWDGLAIGFGLRGNADLTPLFEKLINTMVEEAQPSVKFMFPVKPHLVWESVCRVYGVQQ